MMRQLINLIEELQTDILYRGLPEDQLDDFLAHRISHVGEEWTSDISSLYDFPNILQARQIDLDSIISTDGDDVKLAPDTTIFVASVLINGQWDLIGKNFLT